MLSDLLTTFRLRANIYNNAQFCGDWLIHEHSQGKTCFHMVTVGRCQMVVPGIKEYALELGDLVIFPREIPHHMKPWHGSEQTFCELAMFPPNDTRPGTALLCGTLEFSHKGFDHLLDALPPVMVIKREHAPWIEPLLTLIRHETVSKDATLDEKQADSHVLNRLSELLFFYALQHQTHAPQQTGFLRLFAVDDLQPALSLMKSQPEKPWTLDALGKACSMSRTKFSQRFKAVSGQTVNEFFTWWRMQLAYDALQQGQRITKVAERVGYQSESAFSRAFKKCFALNPSELYKSNHITCGEQDDL